MQIESANNRIECLQKQNECVKRQNDMLMLNIRDLQNNVKQFEETCFCRYRTSGVSASIERRHWENRIKILFHLQLRSLNDEFTQRSEIKNVEFQQLDSKLQLSASINTQLNDELNEKTEQICQLHSANAKLKADIGKLESEIRRMIDNENRVVEQIAAERETAERTKAAYGEWEAQIKTVTAERNEAESKIDVLGAEVGYSIELFWLYGCILNIDWVISLLERWFAKRVEGLAGTYSKAEARFE